MDELKVRCPVCNGMGRLTEGTVKAMKRAADDAVLMRHALFQVSMICQDLVYHVLRKKADLEKLRKHAQTAQTELCAIVPLEWR